MPIPIIAPWGPWVIVSLVGGLILLVSARCCSSGNLAALHRQAARVADQPQRYALALHQPPRVPAAFNGFGALELCSCSC